METLHVGVAECSNITLLKKGNQDEPWFPDYLWCNFLLNFLSFQNPLNSFSHDDKTLPEKDNFSTNCNV